MSLAEAWAIGVVQVFPESVHEEVKLVADGQQRPILSLEFGEEGLTAADVGDVLDGVNVEIILFDLRQLRQRHLRRLLILLRRLDSTIPLHQLLLERLPLLLQERLLLHRILPLDLRLFPFHKQFLPRSPRILEPLAWLQIVDLLRQLLLKDPVFQKLCRAIPILPSIRDRVEALLRFGQRELPIRRRYGPSREIWNGGLSVMELQLFLGELHRRIFLHWCVLLRLLLLLLRFLALLLSLRGLLRLLEILDLLFPLRLLRLYSLRSLNLGHLLC
mmetsp:Transcript_134991/g.288821  ORF Transcript_134991/g.288821 Transcript_134991/m.288821 type:complete len:274 (-) Transcript_134991:1161-1982(-)